MKPQGASVLNPETIASLRELQGEDPVFFHQLMRMFIDSGPDRLQKMGAAILAGSAGAKRLAAEAHNFKSSAGNIGATEVASLCDRLEDLGRKGVVDGAQPIFARLQAAYAAAETEIKALPEMRQAAAA